MLQQSGGPDAEYQRDFLKQARAKLQQEQLEAQERANAREKRNALLQAEQQEGAEHCCLF